MTFLRYGLVQLFAYGIDFGGFLLLMSVAGLAPLTANLVCKFAAGVFAFAAHRRFTFRVGDAGSSLGQGVRYFALLGLNIPLTTGLLALLLRWFSHPAVAKFMADVLILVFTYWVSKKLVFEQPRKPQDGPLK
ncbi:hypothetical protein RD110_04320 [Rhodoferax koreense]|uniref:GtrA/DPMS transmembrane domain-containing protein n=1 Tax=Rhodoferax koreensis TaxID=1842727 RepID=A0A1P8JRZ7_9BURK|nr:GtrA family protein [Rhodoferax koreense]APW36526.1 hypothetical protein RD110_04320 [Rhodoferax koreense]